MLYAGNHEFPGMTDIMRKWFLIFSFITVAKRMKTGKILNADLHLVPDFELSRVDLSRKWPFQVQNSSSQAQKVSNSIEFSRIASEAKKD